MPESPSAAASGTPQAAAVCDVVGRIDALNVQASRIAAALSRRLRRTLRRPPPWR